MNDCVLQATREACSPVLLLQLLQPDIYPEKAAAAVADQARAQVFLYVRTLARTRIDVAARRNARNLIFIKTVSRAKASLSEAKLMQARVFIFVRTLARTRIACRPSFLSRVGAARFWQMLSRRMSPPRFAALLALVLLTAAAVFHPRRGNIFRAFRFLLRYLRR